MNRTQKILLATVLVIAMLTCASYLYLAKKDPAAIPAAPVAISLAHVPIDFTLPAGYGAFEREGFEGGYGSSIFIGKEETPGYFKNTALVIRISGGEYDNFTGKVYEPHEYIDELFRKMEDDRSAEPKWTTLFGNKAVEYTSAAGGDPIITGYIRPDQFPEDMAEYLNNREYLITISGESYGSGVDFDEDVWNTIMGSIRIRPMS